MSAVKLAARGFAPLVSVIPPDAPISPRSDVDPAQRGKCPGKQVHDGWVGYNFTKAVIEPADIDRWGANVGIRADLFPALDIDVASKMLAEAVVALAEQRLGTAPIRSSVEPRKLLMYRTSEPFGRMALIVTFGGKSHLIEFLGEGRQYLIAGKHPSGSQYRWNSDFAPDDLALISRQDVIDFLNELQQRLEAKGLECERVGEGRTRNEEAPAQENLAAPSITALAALIAKIPNHAESAPDWDTYIKFGHAIKAAAADEEEEGLQIFLDWCERCERVPPDLDDAAAQWRRMHAPHRVGWGWLVEQAEKFAGHVSAQDDFSADLEPNETDNVPVTAVEHDARHVDFSDEWAVAKLLPYVRERLRFAPGAGSGGAWFAWAAHKWAQDGGMQHERVVRAQLTKLSLWLQDVANAAPTKEEGKPYRMAAKRFQSADGIASVIRLLRAHVACSPTDFDKDTLTLNTPGGVIDLRDGSLSPSEPAQLLSRSTTCAPAVGDAPMWMRFVRDLTGSDEELQRFVQKMCGYALTGEISEKSLWFVWGSDSDTGKSTFIRALSLLFGDYADTVDVDAFVSSKDRIPADLARLPGVRLVTASESAAAQSWDERRIKAITGGDEISARFLYGQWFTYVPQFKIIIVGNHPPQIREVDDAMLRRVHIVPFNRKVPRDKQVENLAQKMIEKEGPQILQWLIEGCIAWRAEGLQPPEAVLHTTGNYVDEEDTLAQWLDAECQVEEDAVVSRQDLYQAWSAWCRSRGEDPGGAKAFKHKMDGKKAKLELRECQIGERRLRGYRGLRLRLKTEEGTEFE